LLHEEKNWLERVEKKLNSSKIGADAEELSEELDVSMNLNIKVSFKITQLK
jgi:hypothetical protein